MTLKNIFRIGICMAMASTMLWSCSAPNNVTYFQDITDSATYRLPQGQENVIKVEPHDKLSILVNSKDAALAQMFNLSSQTNRIGQSGSVNGTGTPIRNYSIGSSEGISAYTVSSDGTIDFPVLGTLKIAGMTRSEVAAFIKGEIMGRELIKDPVVTVEFLNTGISVLGEVSSPGRYDLNTDELTILEGISLAGDLTIQGQRENVKVLRKNGNSVETILVDLTDAKKLTSSPAYYLKQGDVIYVEPNTQRKRQTTVNGNNVLSTSFWVSVASLLTTVAVLIVK